MFRGKKRKFHDALQNGLVELADKYGVLGDKKFLIEGYEERRNGYIDVVWKEIDGISCCWKLIRLHANR